MGNHLVHVQNPLAHHVQHRLGAVGVGPDAVEGDLVHDEGFQRGLLAVLGGDADEGHAAPLPGHLHRLVIGVAASGGLNDLVGPAAGDPADLLHRVGYPLEVDQRRGAHAPRQGQPAPPADDGGFAAHGLGQAHGHDAHGARTDDRRPAAV